MMQIYDRVLSSGSIPTLIALTSLVLLLYLLYGFLDFIRSRIMIRVGRVGDARLRDDVFNAVAYHGLRRTPTIKNIPLQDLLTIRQFVSGPGPLIFCDLPWAPVYLAVIFLLHPILGAYAAAAMVIITLLASVTDRWTRDPTAAAQRSALQAIAMGDESRRQVESAQALGMIAILRDRWRKVLNDALDHQTLASDRSGLTASASRTMRLIFQSGILAVSAWLAVKREISPGTMIAASIIMSRALAPVEQAVAQWQSFLGFRRAFSRLSELLKQLPPETKRMTLPDPNGRVSVSNLSCFLAGSDRPIIANISFDIPPGTGLGVIGPTGAGKSTLARALVGVWPTFRGSVRLDGAAIEQWDSAQFGRHIGYLPQDVDLFDGTVAENISRFDPQAQSADIVKAARQADVHDLILRFPAGYDTLIGESGARLSAGQRQRIGLARALYRYPVFIVLDEPNANLDAEGESALVKAIIAARERGGTVVVVAHRPSAMAALDMIMMLRDGRRLAFGPSEEVLKKVLSRPRAVPGSSLSVVTPEE